VGIVTFVFETSGVAGQRNLTIPQFGSDKLRIRLVDGMKVPTVTVLRSGGPTYPWVEISISPQDFNQAPCLKYSNIAA